MTIVGFKPATHKELFFLLCSISSVISSYEQLDTPLLPVDIYRNFKSKQM